MSGRKGVLRGKRFHSNHSTVTEPAVRVLDVLRPIESARRVIIGEIRPVRRRANEVRVKALPIQGGLKLSVTGPSAVQEVYVYTDEPALVLTAIQEQGWA